MVMYVGRGPKGCGALALMPPHSTAKGPAVAGVSCVTEHFVASGEVVSPQARVTQTSNGERLD